MRMWTLRSVAGLAAFVMLAVLCGALVGLELGRVLGLCAAQGIRGWFTCRNAILPSPNRYWEGRKHGALYSRHGIVQALARAHAADALTMLDVGSFVPNAVASFDWIPNKVATDIQVHNSAGWHAMRGLSFVQGDYLKLSFATHFDLVTCTQVLEHFSDTRARDFVRKMQLETRPSGGMLIVSVPFEMPKTWIPCNSKHGRRPSLELDSCMGHLQDPLSATEFAAWFNQTNVQQRGKPVMGTVVSHVISRGKVGKLGHQTWANGTRVAAN
eukprot:CAMPEP_0115869734 /NCGR_PEP_ID=MMETSP0287-20121206/21960_1 /TAXON_ID=412157 /ORGANISM="Chrysochromulina rotalis, Strain UIO044" /LENGTH=269 /DNA_ID=CAMNT_0003324427 /DNA_START=7 /DNA_END=813 /DNA_ORIENTATION=+